MDNQEENDEKLIEQTMGKTNKKNELKKANVALPKITGGNGKWRNTVILSLIVVYTLVLFSSSVNHEFVTWDDPAYITQNPLIQDLSLHGMKEIFTTPVIGMYNPVPFLIYAIEYKFWGLDPKGYNWVSILLHLLATILIFQFIFRLSKRYEVASIVALLFAIHPMHVEVVTWASQIKTSLFLIFYFAALLQYLNYLGDNYKVKYLVYAVVLMILSALSKPEAVTLAPMLLLIDYYLSRKTDKRLLLEKIPFFVIALFFGVLTLYTHGEEGDSIFDVTHKYSLLNNLLVSNYSVEFYIERLFYPKQLCTIYDYPVANPYLPIRYYIGIPVIPLIAFLVYKSGKFRKELIFGILFFVISISILLRPVPSGFFGMANRYSYLSYTGLFFIMGQFVVYLIDNRFSYASRVKNFALLSLLFFCLYCTYRTSIRIQVWQNSVTLFDDVIKKQPRLAMAYNHRAAAKSFRGDYKGALDDINDALEIDSNYVDAYNNKAVFEDAIKDYDAALMDCNKAISLNPKYTDAYGCRATILFHKGLLKEALDDFNRTIEMDSNYGNAYFNRALVKVSMKDTTGAVKDWHKANDLGIVQSRNFLAVYGSS